MASYPIVTSDVEKDAYTDACKARNRLTTVVTSDDSITNVHTFFPKVCCICDRLIKHDKECFINIDSFTKNTLIGDVFHQEKQDNVYNLNRYARRNLNRHYTQRFFTGHEVNDDNEIELLNKMILSPKSYGRVVGKKRELGCCSDCKYGIRSITRKDTDNTGPPKYALVNGLMIGTPPKELEDLNEVELAMISLGRSEKHIFSYTGMDQN